MTTVKNLKQILEEQNFKCFDTMKTNQIGIYLKFNKKPYNAVITVLSNSYSLKIFDSTTAELVDEYLMKSADDILQILYSF